jgi:Chaperone of endosialidase
MPVTGTIEQAPIDSYILTDSKYGDILFRSVSGSNRFLFGFSSNVPSALSVDSNLVTVSGQLHVTSSITCAGAVSSFANVSDGRFKNNLIEISEILEEIEKLNPVEFTWSENIFSQDYVGRKDVGMIAQEVEQVFPLITSEVQMPNQEPFKCIRYEKMVPYLVKAIQELKLQNDELKRDLNDIKATLGL